MILGETAIQTTMTSGVLVDLGRWPGFGPPARCRAVIRIRSIVSTPFARDFMLAASSSTLVEGGLHLIDEDIRSRTA